MKTEEAEAERVVLAPTVWEKWVLSLDKYIDPNAQPQKHRYALVAGLVLCPLFFLLMLFVGLPNETALVLLIGIVLVGMGLLAINRSAWRSDRIRQAMLNKQPYDCGCNCNNLRSFGENGWLKSRLVEHYTCTVDEILSAGWVGWLIATALLLFLNWLFTLF
jgi:hypothetical protein